MRSIAISPVLFVLLFFTAPLTADTSALSGDPPQLRPAWIKAGDYVTYLYKITALGMTETIHIKEIIMDDNGTYLNRMRTERFGEQINPDFPSRLGHLQPSAEEAGPNRVHYDPTFLMSEDKVASLQPEVEEVRGLNNMTYEAYKIPVPELWTFGELCECNRTYWYEKETLVKIKELEWWRQDGMDVWAERIIEDSNVPQLATPSTSNTAAKTVTTTIFVMPPQTIMTTTVTVTTTVKGPQTVATTTFTETRNTSENTDTVPISAGIVVAGVAISIALLKRRSGPN